ncbi:MAG: hypothetical protein AAGM67_05105 [Bacteroidota bacterium]
MQFSRFFQKLRCKVPNQDSLRQHYQTFSRAELEKEETRLNKVYGLSGLAWLFAALLIISSSSMSFVVLLLFSAAVFGTLVSMAADYQNRMRIIKSILKSLS